MLINLKKCFNNPYIINMTISAHVKKMSYKLERKLNKNLSCGKILYRSIK